jgi:hypothetical protein
MLLGKLMMLKLELSQDSMLNKDLIICNKMNKEDLRLNLKRRQLLAEMLVMLEIIIVLLIIPLNLEKVKKLWVLGNYFFLFVFFLFIFLFFFSSF